MTLLSEQDRMDELKTVRGWVPKTDQISKMFEFGDFVHAMGFVNSVALLAERANHHPDIDIRWNKVTLTLSTHSAGGLTMKDFDLARQIENI